MLTIGEISERRWRAAFLREKARLRGDLTSALAWDRLVGMYKRHQYALSYGASINTIRKVDRRITLNVQGVPFPDSPSPPPPRDVRGQHWHWSPGKGDDGQRSYCAIDSNTRRDIQLKYLGEAAQRRQQ